MGADIDFDPHKTLMQLDPDAWDPDALDPEWGVFVQRLANKPLRKFLPTEMYALLQRQLGLPFVVPLAINRLEADPFLQAAQYPGDLLTVLIEVDSRFWNERYDLWDAMMSMLDQVWTRIQTRMEEEQRGDYLPWHLSDEFMAALLHFRSIHEADKRHAE